MTAERCRVMVPMWAAQEAEPEFFPPKPRKTPQDWFHDFKTGDKIGFILILWIASLILACFITSVIVRHNTTVRVTEEVTSQLRADFQRYLEQQEAERRAAQFLTGDASFEAAVGDLAEPMAQVLATYAQDYSVTQEGLYTIGWVFCARYAQNSTEFGRTPQEILEKSSAWEGKVLGHAVRNQDTELARSIAREFLNGKYPDGYTTALTFFTRESGGKIIARNELYTGPYTTYWWFGK